MDTQNTSLNTRVSAASRGRVRKRQVVLSEHGRRAARMFLEGQASMTARVRSAWVGGSGLRLHSCCKSPRKPQRTRVCHFPSRCVSNLVCLLFGLLSGLPSSFPHVTPQALAGCRPQRQKLILMLSRPSKGGARRQMSSTKHKPVCTRQS